MSIVRGALRIFWKELFELYKKPLIPIALVALSIAVVWTSGQLNIRQPTIGILLYTGGATEPALTKARRILNDFAHTSVTEVDGYLVDADTMEASDARLAIVFRNGEWLLMYRFPTARQEAQAVQLIGSIAYFLHTNKPLSGLFNPARPKIRVHLYKSGANEANVKRVRDILAKYSNISVVDQNGDGVDTAALEKDMPSIGLIYTSTWFFLPRFATADQAADASRTVALVAYEIEHTSLSSEDRALLLDPIRSDAVTASRVSALPGEPQLELIPRTIALIVVFLPFVLTTRSYSREVASGTLPLLLSLPEGGWTTLAVGKVAACVWIVLSVLSIVFMATSLLLNFGPKPGILLQLGVQGLAMLVSACLGLMCAILARSQSQVYLLISVYFLALVLVSGFLFPLETAAPLIRLASHFSPLTFSGRIMESWLFFGTSPLVFVRDIAFLVAQGLVGGALLACSIWFVRHRM